MVWDGIEHRQAPSRCQVEILERLTKIEVEFAMQRGLLQEIRQALRGNGTEGLLIRHDRVERTMSAMVWVLAVTSVAVIGLLVKRVMG